MPHPLTGPLVGFASRLRFPTLFKITLALMLVSWLWPFDPIPFLDEIVTALATLVLASWKRSDPPTAPPSDQDRVIEGQARRE
ncbi:DUF6116 family protein [Arenimonas fontis]|uniref:Uncharacterized protein n=1 Tax=Arenimonas fontis TaxID=2608255 RepID=A0A5B2Z6P4_9GAMM|nr:DUF6116 family protein [Arenimonas fontis]KAA2284448.1 hypothetical protein F0415_08980 [Arenimonas fontis]